MEWVKKKTFEDYYKEALEQPKETIYREELAVMPFLFQISAPKIQPKHEYKVKRKSLDERKQMYLNKIPVEAKQIWKDIETLSEMHHIIALPWETKSLYRKLALKMHPDHSRDPNAHENFMVLRMLFQRFEASIADACT